MAEHALHVLSPEKVLHWSYSCNLLLSIGKPAKISPRFNIKFYLKGFQFTIFSKIFTLYLQFVHVLFREFFLDVEDDHRTEINRKPEDTTGMILRLVGVGRTFCIPQSNSALKCKLTIFLNF